MKLLYHAFLFRKSSLRFIFERQKSLTFIEKLYQKCRISPANRIFAQKGLDFFRKRTRISFCRRALPVRPSRKTIFKYEEIFHMKLKNVAVTFAALVLAVSMTACGSSSSTAASTSEAASAQSETSASSAVAEENSASSEAASEAASSEAASEVSSEAASSEAASSEVASSTAA